MSQPQLVELKSLVQENSHRISVNHDMIGRIYEEHGGRLAGLEGGLRRVEVGQEQLSHDLRAVAEGVTGNAERIGRLEGRFDGLKAKIDHLSAVVMAGFTAHEQRIRALED